MKLKLFTLLFCSLFLYQNNQAQAPINIWTQGYEIGQAYSLETYNHHLFMVGTENLSNGAGFYVSKLDTMGNQLWKKSFGYPGNISLNGMGLTLLNNGEMAAVGSYFDPSINNAYAQTMLLRLDAQGDTLWTRKYNVPPPSNQTIGIFNIRNTHDNGFILSGNQVIRTDASGNVNWMLNYTAYEMIQLPDSGFIFCGTLQGSGNSDAYIMRVNANGDSLWRTELDLSIFDRPDGLRLSQDGNSLFVAGTMNQDSSGSTFGRDIFLAKMNLQGDTLWVKKEVDIFPDQIMDMEIDPNGNLDILMNREMFVGPTSQLVVLAQYDTTGTAVWGTFWGDVGIDYLHDLEILNGSYYAVGVLNGFVPQMQAAKFSADTTISVDPPSAFADIKIYPNPTNSVLNLTFSPQKVGKISVMDLSGKMLMEVPVLPQESEIRLNVANLSKGIYIARIQSIAGEYLHYKFSVQ